MLVESAGCDQKGAINVYSRDSDPSFVNCQIKKKPVYFLTACSLSLLFSSLSRGVMGESGGPEAVLGEVQAQVLLQCFPQPGCASGV